MDKSNNKGNQLYGHHRKSIYASINSYKGKFIIIRESNLTNREEKEAIAEVIEAIEKLRTIFLNNRTKKNGKEPT